MDRTDGEFGCPDSGGKHRLSAPACPEPVPLVAMIVLREGEVGYVRLKGVDAVNALLSQVYSPLLVHPDQPRRRVELALDLASGVPVFAAAPRSLTTEQVDHRRGGIRVTLRVPPHVHFRAVHDEVVLLDTRTGASVGLNASAAVAWSVLSAGGSAADAVAELVARFEVAPEVASADVDTLIDGLLSGGMLEAVEP